MLPWPALASCPEPVVPRQAVQRMLPWADSCEYHRCSACGAPQPTARLLDIHLSEMHDSFFAAQAARKLKVLEAHSIGSHNSSRARAAPKAGEVFDEC